MNLNTNLGRQSNGEDFILDFAKQDLHMILLVGATGTGKSVFNNILYKNLMLQNTPSELSFVFLDNTGVDFTNWKTNYILKLVIDKNEGLKTMEEFADLAVKRSRGEADNSQAIFVHIEECDLIYLDTPRFEAAWSKFSEFKEKSNMYIIYSTSRIGERELAPTILKHTDLRVVFGMASEEGSKLVLGSGIASKFDKPGQRVLVYGSKQVFCEPYPEVEARAMAIYNKID